ncbi:MAG: GGDEF domain-containing protein [Gammaproteobacteria bacterium]|nr:GGDEF domain-containing protein [Gammaproteobacteria bacterium]NNF61703.1 GGDEF domain-containing protein [Gammaproteobacteria bacterium]NNM21758.1 GGDEF domain-containing protein [Gammaproteobacteria bacterium]
MKQRIKSHCFWPTATALAAAIFFFDLNQPLGVAGGMPCVLLVLLALATNSFRAVAVLTLTATMLILAGYALSGAGAPLSVVTVNRGMALLIVLATGITVCLIINQRQRLEMITRLDPLTGVYNRHHLRSVLDREINLWRRDASPLSVIMLDIDHFKSINDTHGHQAGDFVLRAVAGICAENIRNSDWVCRYGGEEFVIVLPQARHRDAGEVAERIRRAVGATRFEVGGSSARVTVSLGVAEVSPQHVAAGDLLHAADLALYEAKNSGRNKVSYDRDTNRHKKAHAGGNPRRAGGFPALSARLGARSIVTVSNTYPRHEATPIRAFV